MLTKKGALVELVIVTAGVLVALSAETVREWRSNRSLAAEARANIRDEMRRNLQQIDIVLEGFKEARAALFQARAIGEARLAGQPSEGGNLDLGLRLAGISAAAYETAEITGAFAHMEPLEVQRFAAVYRMQRQFDEMQDRALVDMGMLTATADRALDHDSPPDPATARAWLDRIDTAIAAINLRFQLAGLLKPAYEQLLKE